MAIQTDEGELRITQTGEEPEVIEPDDGDGDEETPFLYDENLPNLVKQFKKHPLGEKALEEFSRQFRDNYAQAFDSTAEYRERKEKDWKILVGNLPKKEGKFAGGANPHVPIALENTTRNWMRAEAELFGDWNNVFGVAPLGPNDDMMAQILTLHGNWQIRTQIPDFRRQMSRGMLGFFYFGDITCHSYYDMFRKQNRHEILTCDDFFVPYTFTSTMPDWSDVPWRIKLQAMYPHQLEERRAFWEGVEEMLDKAPDFDDADMEAHKAIAQDEGVDMDEVKAAAPYIVLWWEGWLELPNQNKRRWCRAMADLNSDTIFELAIHEEADWQDQIRFDAQMKELADFRSMVQAQEQFMLEQQRTIDGIRQQIDMAHGAGIDASAAEAELQQAEQALATMAGPPPPNWVDNPDDPDPKPEPVRTVPIQLFAHGVCIEPIIGNLGIGYGHMQADFNRAANTALAQFTDAAAGNNLKSFLALSGIEFDGKDQLTLSTGKVIRVDGSIGDDIRKAIMPFGPEPANPQLVEVVKMVMGFAQSSMQSSPILSGEGTKSGEPFRAVAARIEQATKQLSVTTGKYGFFLTQILKNNAKLNAVYMDEEEFFNVALQSGSPFWALSLDKPPSAPDPNNPAAPPKPLSYDGSMGAQFKVGRSMYERSYHVEIRSDLRFATQSQKIQEADEMVGMANKIPYLQGNQAFQYETIKKALLARGRNDLVPLLGPPPPPPAAPPGPPMPPGGQPGMPPPGARPPMPNGGAQRPMVQ